MSEHRIENAPEGDRAFEGWEPWQLTAFALGELESEEAQKLEQDAARNPELAAELQMIRETVGQVQGVFAAEQGAVMDPDMQQQRFEQVMDACETEGDSSVEPAAVAKRPLRYVPLLAMSACLLVAVGLALPELINGWQDVEVSSVTTQSPEEVNQELREELQGVEDELKDEPTARRFDSGASMPEDGYGSSELPFTADLDNMSLDQSGEPEAVPGYGGFDISSKNDQAGPSSGASLGRDFDVSEGSDRPSDKKPTVDQLAQLGDDFGDFIAPAEQGGQQGGQQGQQSPDGLQRQGARYAIAEQVASEEKQVDQQQAPGQQQQGSEERDFYRREVETLDVAGNENVQFWEDSSRGVSAGAPIRGYAYHEEQEASGGALYGGGMGGMGGGGGGMGGEPESLSLLTENARSRRRGGRKGTELDSFGVETKLESEGRGSERYQEPVGTDRFATIFENPFEIAKKTPLSTLSIDVDTASFVKTRQYLLESHQLPPPGAVRLEEFINYFEYEYNGPEPESEAPFGVNLTMADCPWNESHKLMRVGLQAEKLNMADRPPANIVFLLDVSGSMSSQNKLPLVKEAMEMVIRQLGEKDRVAMAVYAGAAGCVLEGTSGGKQKKILKALDRLNAGGSTNGGEGIQLAYNLARDNFIEEGINRVILCTDGDFNVGVTSTSSLVEMVAENAKSNIFLTVLGFGMGNSNDSMMEQISNRGNGVYAFVDNRREAQKQMVQQLASNLVTVAKDVKVQVEFNPQRVKSYRLLGYENRILAAEDFANDKKDAGEIGAGHRVTALYEIVPFGVEEPKKHRGIPLRYQPKPEEESPAEEPVDAEVAVDEQVSSEWLWVKLRYKQPDGDTSTLVDYPFDQESVAYEDAGRDLRWAVSMAEFGMLLRGSHHNGDSNWGAMLERARSAAGVSPDEDRTQCLKMIEAAVQLSDR